MALAATPALPKEVWEHILSYGAICVEYPFEFIDLWQAARQTSRLLRVSVAQVFLDNFVRNPKRCMIYCDVGEDFVPDMETGYVHQFELKLAFDRMDENSALVHNRRTRVVFKECKETKMIPNAWPDRMKSAHKRKKYRAWKDAIETYLGTDECGDAEGGGCFDRPPHVICIYGQANDTELPGLRFDVDKAEISFEWEGMLHKFLSERAEFSARTAVSLARYNKVLAETDLSKVLGAEKLKVVKDGLSLSDKTHKQLRRERIFKHYRAIDDFWEGKDIPFDDEEEAGCLQRINERVGEGSGRPPFVDEEPDYTDMINVDEVDATAHIDSEDESDSDEMSESNGLEDDYMDGA